MAATQVAVDGHLEAAALFAEEDGQVGAVRVRQNVAQLVQLLLDVSTQNISNVSYGSMNRWALQPGHTSNLDTFGTPAEVERGSGRAG